MTEVMEQTPPALHGPSEKERKYDRQLRLWAASGQSALESAHILLVNSGCGTVGIETLKNLVLPGIGKFTIADEAIVSDSDLGVNFFLDESSRGRSRAECCTELLLELNPEVEGHWWPEPNASSTFDGFLQTSEPFTTIMYSMPISPERLRLLQEYGKEHQTPLVAIHSVGFYGYFSVSLPGTFPIVDTHPDETATTDLRLLSPWPELSEFAKEMTKNIDTMDNHEHGHLPLVVILLHYLDKWKQSHDGAYPIAYQDKIAFRNMVSDAMRRDNPEGGEENFEEAVGAVMKHVVKPDLPGTLKQVFECSHPDSQEARSSFWIIADAVRQFYEKNDRLPVTGSLPDMKALSTVYIKLQNIYKEKARRDAAEVLDLVRSAQGGEDVDPAEVEQFCSNARFIKLINGADVGVKSLAQVTEQELGNDEVAAIAGPEMPFSLIPIYLALTSTSHTGTATAKDIMASITERVPAAAGKERILQAAEEVARSGGNELHNISAVIGGMVAQEMIKIITKQYIPIDNVCIFDGIDSRCQVARL
ncbi:NEDD8-activating enzyme E1 regulatory subunit-like protein [Hapsidospora chrysogenum ATCC 11550]|uniref:NEDD8-activating enzyme E1 regulatory subunit n=1 Tax=Hapsidospora chrysogenum (strain ATCC 11550 / CBS 779.69 / DSM 880 / IAM 14645 / JCM 23072 / IMI 49137) TaxID=857340 RepID=A0A086SZ02_HAPC1|nr:NEDD8-activating enzyme E1 regulatory subunit-like protein [Hapsidospora chrysogenum ATCC 11550]